MRDKGLTFHLKAVITNAEPLYKYQEEVISEAFKCQVVETYGQAELVSFANRFPEDGSLPIGGQKSSKIVPGTKDI